ncbi:MAG: RsmB/NOP family class I SAM-dependent RNA methyltransferase [Magnetococcales bacterium]|nr:RsmB/NOP family class I SAM-dependent RNA methyltransferase [Magnetococcales bacterium]
MIPHQAHNIRLAIDHLEQILDPNRPTTPSLTRHLRAQANLGPQERTLIGDLVHGVLRHRRHLDPALTATPSQLIATALIHLFGWSAERVRGEGGITTPPLPSPAAAIDQPPAVRHSLPDWLWTMLVTSHGAEEAEELATALNREATLDLRVNPRLGDRAACRAALHAAGVETLPTLLSPVGLRLSQRLPLGTLAAYRRGWIEVQDEGSQLIALLVAPEPGQTVVDLCAGGGGKTLHLAQLMGDRGRIIATDTDARRLAGLRPRQRRAGLRAIRPLVIRHEGDSQLRSLTGKADRVLLDVPCSGSGTLRRHPEQKWRLTPEAITTFTVRQSALLAAGARLIRPGGRLIYATCSILEAENQAVVDYFLRTTPDFHLRAAAPLLAAAGVAGEPTAGPFLALAPHRHGTDGFFAAVMERKR